MNAHNPTSEFESNWKWCFLFTLSLLIIAGSNIFGQPEIAKLNLLTNEALNTEDRRDAEISILKKSLEENDLEEVKKRKSIIDLIDIKQGELVLDISRILYKNNLMEKESAVAEFIKTEKAVVELQNDINTIKGNNLDEGDLDLALIALRKNEDLWRERAIQEGLFMMGIEITKRRYPEFSDENSEFSKRLQRKIDHAVVVEDKILENPRHVLIFAEQVKTELESKKTN
jgi:hypothetical protein